MVKRDIGFYEAMDLGMSCAHHIGTKSVSVADAVGMVAAGDVSASVDSPSADVSLKDGYAVISSDIANASPDNPVTLKLVDQVAAGERSDRCLMPGEAIRILSGAPLPEGAEAVLTEELTGHLGDFIQAHADAHPGRNVLEQGTDIGIGQILVKIGDMLTPQRIGLLIAGGVNKVKVYKKPKIGLLATGSEVIMPGEPMAPGKVYASNVGTLRAWLSLLGFDVCVLSAIDSVEQISRAMAELSRSCDMVITSGGAWKGDRDLIATVMRSLGGEMVYHRIRLGPGKASGMGILNNALVFCLPGGPSANMFGFVMLVLPVLFKMTGTDRCPYLLMEGWLEKTITGHAEWTNLIQCAVVKNGQQILLRPEKLKSRLFAMASQLAIVIIPEGVGKFDAGDIVPFICLDTEIFAYQVYNKI